MVALSGGPEGETLIRRAARITARSGADLLAVHDAPPRCWRSLTRKRHPADGRRNPAKLAGRASARNHDQIAGHPPRRRNRRAHRHLRTHRQRRPTRGV